MDHLLALVISIFSAHPEFGTAKIVGDNVVFETFYGEDVVIPDADTADELLSEMICDENDYYITHGRDMALENA